MAEKKKNPSKKQKRNTGHDNLKGNRHSPWKPGQSGNPAGRPKNEKMMSDVLRELLECKTIKMSVEANGKSVNINIKSDRKLKYAIGIALIAAGVKGDVKAFREIADRVEGRAVQNVNAKFTEDNRHDHFTDIELAKMADYLEKENHS